MSRIGKNPVIVPKDVTVDVSGQTVKVKGKLGEMSLDVHESVAMKMQDGADGSKEVIFEAVGEDRKSRMLWPTFRNHVKNMVEGVSKGYSKKLEIKGVGFRANIQGDVLVLQIGYSHDVRYPIPQGIKIAVDKQVNLAITGVDKQQVGQVAAEIIAFRKPEPYKGKGIRYEGQKLRQKEGKKK